MNFLDKPYEMNVSLYQLGVLLLFNSVDMLSFQKIKQQSRLNDSELNRILKVFLDMKLIQVSDDSSPQNPSFSLNLKFSR